MTNCAICNIWSIAQQTCNRVRLGLGLGLGSGLVLELVLGLGLRNWPNAQRVWLNVQHVWLNVQIDQTIIIASDRRSDAINY